jgi:hypothetical protein
MTGNFPERQREGIASRGFAFFCLRPALATPKKNRSREEASLLTGLKRFSWWNPGKEEGFLMKDSPARLPQQAVDGSNYKSTGPEFPGGYS